MPTVIFSGQGPDSRSDHIAEARARGWHVGGRPAEGVDIMVAGEDSSRAKARAAATLGIKVITFAEWADTILTGEV